MARSKKREGADIEVEVDPLKYAAGGRLASFLSSASEMKYLEEAELVSNVHILKENVFGVRCPPASYWVHLYQCQVRPFNSDILAATFCERDVLAWGGKSNHFKWLEEDTNEILPDRFDEDGVE